MTMTLEDIIAVSDRLFSFQAPMRSLYQTLADNFYPERADFTVTRNVGSELADGLVDSYPVLMRRDLGNSFGSMLRDGQDWFDMDVRDGAGYDGKMWLQESTTRMRGLMYDRSSNFVRSTREGDHDYATFGQCVLSIEPNRTRSGLLYRNWHLRDCAWSDDETGQVGQVHRKWAPTVYDLKRLFGDKIHRTHVTLCEKTPMKEVSVRHIVMPADMYGKDEFMRFKNVSLFVDMDNKHILQEQGIDYPYYVVPRFQTIAGSAYAYSPATVAGLPNARMLQAMTHTLLEAAERMARPPLAATQRAVNSNIDLGPDGITWIDNEYDERFGSALRPVFQDRGNFPIGDVMRQGVVEILGKAFYLDKLNLPPVGHDMTAYEVSERMKQFRRENLPLFAPLETDYNGQLCEASFEIALNFGMLGSPDDIPTELQGKDTEFKFKSPLRAQEEEQRAQQFQQTGQLLAQAAEFDPGVRHNVNMDVAFRDAVEATGSPTKWLNSMETVVETRQTEAAAQMAMQGQAPEMEAAA